MSRRHEDFDEFCDPHKPVRLTIDMVLKAADELREHIHYTPCVPSNHQQAFTTYIHYKLDLLQHTGSFKERGILNALLTLPEDKKKIGVVTASSGNAAIALCYHAAKLKIPAIVVLTTNVSFAMVQRCQKLGAKVVIQGYTLWDAMRFARALARDKGRTYINSLDHPQVLAGYGTLALEIIYQMPFVDAVLVPVGSGGLAAGVATVMKRVKPDCLIYGVQPESCPVFFRTLEQSSDVVNKKNRTMARSVDVPGVGINSFYTVKDLLDKMLLVKDDWIARAMLHLYEEERYYAEGAAACPLAAIIGNLVPELKLKNVVCVITGGNENPLIFYRCIEKGMACEGRLLRFKVDIEEGTKPIKRLIQILAMSGYRIVDINPDTKWINQEACGYLTTSVLVETKNLEHALDLKKIMDKAYPFQNSFETEPFNDSRTCPCFVHKQTYKAK